MIFLIAKISCQLQYASVELVTAVEYQGFVGLTAVSSCFNFVASFNVEFASTLPVSDFVVCRLLSYCEFELWLLSTNLALK